MKIDTSEYEKTYGEKPRGRNYWRFRIVGNGKQGQRCATGFLVNKTYREASAYAKAVAVKMGFNTKQTAIIVNVKKQEHVKNRKKTTFDPMKELTSEQSNETLLHYLSQKFVEKKIELGVEIETLIEAFANDGCCWEAFYELLTRERG